jgi:hypothetical protein
LNTRSHESATQSSHRHEEAAAQASLRRAVRLDEQQPTYYGAAWTALGAVTLTGSVLGGCPPISGGTGDRVDDG